MALQQLRTVAEWTKYFTDAGIPQTESTTYATTFVNNRITEVSLVGLDRNTLASLEITVLGDQLAILNHTTTNTPVVASAHGGSLDIIQDGVNGYLFPPSDTTALAENISTTLSNEAASFRDHIEQHFSLAVNTEKLLAIYRGVA